MKFRADRNREGGHVTRSNGWVKRTIGRIDLRKGLAMPDYLYRTFNLNPTDYERQLSDALFAIMGRQVHDAPGIAAELDKTGPQAASGGRWTAELLKSEMRRLGSWTNSIGAPVGAHSAPGMSVRKHER